MYTTLDAAIAAAKARLDPTHPDYSGSLFGGFEVIASLDDRFFELSELTAPGSPCTIFIGGGHHPGKLVATVME